MFRGPFRLMFFCASPVCAALQMEAQATFGDLSGFTLRPDKQALPLAQVTAHNVDENTDHTVVSGADGSFAIENLKVGHYQVTGKKEGFETPPPATVDLVAGQSLHIDIPLTASTSAPSNVRAARQSQDSLDGSLKRIGTTGIRLPQTPTPEYPVTRRVN